MAKPIAFHVDAFGSAVDLAEGSREGIWWLPTKDSTDTLIITNRASEEVKATLTVTGASARKFDLPITLAPFGTTRLSVKTLLAAHGITDEYGGVELHAVKNAGYLDTVHFVVDEQTHFSALLKMFRYSDQDSMKTRKWSKDTSWLTRAPILALTNPDPELHLPKDAKLHPKLFVRNVTAHPVAIGLSFNWRNDQSHGTAAGPSLTLAPLSTRMIDVSELQASGVIPLAATWASVALRAGPKPHEVMAIATSFSDEAAYGAQTPFNDQLAFHWAGGMFLVDALHNSLTTVGNGGSEPAKAQFLLWTEQAASSNATPVPYELEQTLQPGEHMWVNIGDLIRRRVPDKHGKVLPANLTSGTYEFLDETNRAHGSLFEGKVITDKTNGHATYGCMECCGYNSAYMDPFGLNLGSSSPMPIEGQNSCNGFTLWSIVDLFSYFTSDTTSFVSFPNYQNGTAYAAAVGTANLYAIAFNVQEDSGGADFDSCPTNTINAGGPAYVASLTCTTVTRGQVTTCTASGPSGTTFNTWSFSDGTNTVTSQNGSTSTTWTATAVISGYVTAVANLPDGSTMQATGPLTVTSRYNHTSPASAQEVPNGTGGYLLPVPPAPSGNARMDSNLGISIFTESIDPENNGNAQVINDNGPNNSYVYFAASRRVNTSYQYVINPDLENAGSLFYSMQTGTFDLTGNPGGFISGSNLLYQNRKARI